MQIIRYMEKTGSFSIVENALRLIESMSFKVSQYGKRDTKIREGRKTFKWETKDRSSLVDWCDNLKKLKAWSTRETIKIKREKSEVVYFK